MNRGLRLIEMPHLFRDKITKEICKCIIVNLNIKSGVVRFTLNFLEKFRLGVLSMVLGSIEKKYELNSNSIILINIVVYLGIDNVMTLQLNVGISRNVPLEVWMLWFQD